MSVTPLFPPSDTRDRLPLWVLVLLGLFFALRIAELHGDFTAARSSRMSGQTGQIDKKVIQDAVSATVEAKSAYTASLSAPGAVNPDTKSLRKALKSAELLQVGTENSPGAARQVIILRALLHLPLLQAGKTSPNPADAFLPAALAKATRLERVRYRAEGRLWADVARGPHLTPAQTAQAAALLQTTPNIRWWRGPALSVLYQSQGNPRLAQHFANTARTEALLTQGPMVVLGLFEISLILIGTGLLVAFLVRGVRGRTKQESAAEAPGFWPTLRETVPADERRLRAGDLMGVFVLYLLMENIIGWLVGGFGVRHLFYYPGLLKPYLPYLHSLPSGERVTVNIIFSAVAYLVAAAVPVAVLIGIAARKRASIAEELGFNRHRLGLNFLYGVGGFAIALPLSLLGAGLGSRLPGPTPSNPAIPMLAGAGSVWGQVTLIALATLAAPLCEEFLFRGVFYNAAKLKVGVWPAIILTGLIFGFVHPVGIGEMVPLAVLGGVFAWMAETRKSLVPGMVGHFLQNSMATLMLLLALGS